MLDIFKKATIIFAPKNNSGGTRYMQYVSSLVATLSVASMAMHLSWSAPTLPKLTSEDSPIGVTLTNEQASWVASIVLVASIPGGLLTGVLVEKFGRKKPLLFSAGLLFAPWIAVVFAKSALSLIITRFVAGLGIAIAATSVSMYIGEIAEKDIRGQLGTFICVLKLTGSLYVLSVGPFISYTALALSCSVLPLIFAVSFVFMPETPYYLVKAGHKDAARNNLITLSSKNADKESIERQLDDIKETVDADMKNKSTVWELFSKKKYRKSLMVMLGVKTLQQFSGSDAIDAYMQIIIQSSGSSITPEVSSIIFGFIQIPAVLVATALVDKMGRKPLLIISALGCAVALVGEGTYFYLQDVVKADIEYLAWLPTTGLVLFLIMNPVGLLTLPYILLGELFATNIKGVAVSAFTVYGGLLSFLVVKFFTSISDAWGMYTMFWTYAVVCVVGSLFVFFLVPETKGKTFGEIQAKLNKKTIHDVVA